MRVGLAPVVHRVEHGLQALPEIGERVFDARRNLGEHLAAQDPVALELSKLFRERARRDSAQVALEAVEALRAVQQVVQHEDLPPALDDPERRLDRTPHALPRFWHDRDTILQDSKRQCCAYWTEVSLTDRFFSYDLKAMSKSKKNDPTRRAFLKTAAIVGAGASLAKASSTREDRSMTTESSQRRKVAAVRTPPPRHWVGDGFPV